MTDPVIDKRLLDYLCLNTGAQLEYAEPPSRITGGFDTHIYAFRLSGAPNYLAGHLILRLFREDNPWVTLPSGQRALFESTVQNAIAEAGYSAPRVFAACTENDVLGAPFLIMEKLQGRVMLEMLFRPSRIWLRLPEMLAQSQARLHALDPAALINALESHGLPVAPLSVSDWIAQVQTMIDYAALDGLRPGMRWLHDNAPAAGTAVICHGDFHPLNILVHAGAVSGVIDWPWVRLADPAYDVGATVAIFSQGPLALPDLLARPVQAGRQWLLSRYRRAYQRLRPLDETAVAYYEALRCLGFLLEAGMHWQADAKVIRRPEKPSAFATVPVARSVIRRLRRITGLTLSLPNVPRR